MTNGDNNYVMLIGTALAGLAAVGGLIFYICTSSLDLPLKLIISLFVLFLSYVVCSEIRFRTIEKYINELNDGNIRR